MNNIEDKIRCLWCINDPIYIKYHDEEWGLPVHDEVKHFEFLTLETFQAGLSWITMLRKRDNFAKAFSNFEPEKIVKYDDKKINELLNNTGIIRNKLKIESTIKNAHAFLKIQQKFGSFDNFIWSFTDGKQIVHQNHDVKQIPVYNNLAEKISKVLKKEGFSFIGPTIVYAHIQAIGIINDHLVSCFRYEEVQKGIGTIIE